MGICHLRTFACEKGFCVLFFLNTYVWFHGKDQNLIRMESVEIL